MGKNKKEEERQKIKSTGNYANKAHLYSLFDIKCVGLR